MPYKRVKKQMRSGHMEINKFKHLQGYCETVLQCITII